MSNKDLTFRLFGEDKTASESLNKLSSTAENVSGRIGRGFVSAGKLIGGLGLAAATAAAAGAAAIVATGIGEAMDASKGVAQLQAGLKSTGNAANVTVKHMEDLAGSIQGMSGQTDDSIVAAQSLLLTFTNIKNSGPDKIFDQATRASADMAARMGGDAASNAVRLGKALNDPIKGITALSKVGVSFDEGQKEQIKTLVKHGETVKAQKIILAELNKEFGGSAKAAGQSLPGQLERAKRAFEDVSQTVVETILPVVTPAIEGIAGAVKKAEPFLASMAEVVRDKLAAGLKILGGFIGPIFDQLAGGAGGAAPKVMELVQVVGEHLMGAFGKIRSAVGPIIGEIPGLVQKVIPVFAQLYMAVVDAVGQIVPPLMKVVGTVLPFVVGTVQAILPPVVSVFKGIVAAIAPLLELLSVVLPPVFNALLTVIQPVFQTIAAVINGALRVVRGVIETVLGVITGNWSKAWAGIQDIFGGVVDALVGIVKGWVTRFAKPFEQAWSTVSAGAKSAWKGITGFLSDAVDNVVGFVRDGVDGLVSAWKRGWGLIVSAVSSVAGKVGKAVSDLIDGVVGFVSDGIATLRSNWSRGWSIIVSAVSTANGQIVSAVQGVIGKVVAFFAGLGAKVKGAIGDAGQMLATIGRQIIDGLVGGIRGGVGAIQDAVNHVIGLIPAGARKLLGIASPSRVFRQIGAWVGEGLIKGLAGTEDQVKSAMGSLVEKVTSAFDKLADQREASQKRLEKLDKRLADVDTSKEAGRKRAAALRTQIADEKELQSQLAATSKIKKSALLKQLEDDTAALTKLAARRDALGEQLKQAQDKLEQAVQVRNDYRDSVSGSAQAGGDIAASFSSTQDQIQKAVDQASSISDQIAALDDKVSGAGDTRQSLVEKLEEASGLASTGGTDSVRAAAANKVKTLTKQLADLDGDVARYADDRQALTARLETAKQSAALSPVDVLLSNLRDQVAKTDQFRDVMAKLKTQGLDDVSYKQLVDSGVDDGLQTGLSLLSSGGAVGEVTKLQAQLKTASDQLGKSTSDTLYQAGVDSAQKLTDGISSQIIAVTGAMGAIEVGLAEAVSRLGVNTSALSASAGTAIAAALGLSLQDKKAGVGPVMDELSTSARDAIAKLGLDGKKTAKKAGHDIVAGLKKGMTEKAVFDELFDGMSKGMIASLKKALGIKSPSRRFRDEVGIHIPAGVVEGVRLGARDLDREVAAMVNVPRYATAPGSTGLPGQVPTADGGQKALVHIDNFHATPEQSPADIAADLGWLARGGL